MSVSVGRELPPDTLAMTVTGRDGVLYRWGPDEVDAADVPMALEFGTSIPNGHKDLTSSLLRQITTDWADNQLLANVKVYGPGQRSVWEGRMTQFPREHGDDFNITPSAVGHAAHLLDDPQFTMPYVNRDMSTWGDITTSRKAGLAAGGFPQGKIQASSDGTGLVWQVPNEALPTNEVQELYYNPAPGTKIAKIVYKGTRSGTWTNFEAPSMYASDDMASFDAYTLTLDGTLRSTTLTTAARRYLLLRALATAGVTPPAGTMQSYTVFATYGNHGLTTAPIAGEPDGFYLSDLVADVVRRGAPLLSTADVQANSIVVPHAVFEATTASEAVLSLNNYAQWDWGVYDDKRFFFRPPDPDRLTWTVRLDEGTHLDLEGEESDDQYNGVVVYFTDTAGIARSYGPSGANADYTDASLADANPENPVNAAGIPRKWGKLTVPAVTTPAGALAIGRAWLGEKMLPQRRGTCVVSGYAMHPTAGLRPAWEMRAGDFVAVTDHPASVPRKIIETRYNRQARTNTLTVGNTSHKVDAIMEMFGAVLVGLG